eukprot:1815180-Rhodomonas_salina.1
MTTRNIYMAKVHKKLNARIGRKGDGEISSKGVRRIVGLVPGYQYPGRNSECLVVGINGVGAPKNACSQERTWVPGVLFARSTYRVRVYPGTRVGMQEFLPGYPGRYLPGYCPALCDRKTRVGSSYPGTW